MTRFILVINDPGEWGYNCKDVETFPTREDACQKMTELYRERAKKRGIDPSVNDTRQHGITADYAYIFGDYYLDIFEKHV